MHLFKNKKKDNDILLHYTPKNFRTLFIFHRKSLQSASFSFMIKLQFLCIKHCILNTIPIFQIIQAKSQKHKNPLKLNIVEMCSRLRFFCLPVCTHYRHRKYTWIATQLILRIIIKCSLLKMRVKQLQFVYRKTKTNSDISWFLGDNCFQIILHNFKNN